ncbi:unnamed protein product [Caretta caretta]
MKGKDDSEHCLPKKEEALVLVPSASSNSCRLDAVLTSPVLLDIRDGITFDPIHSTNLPLNSFLMNCN